MKFSQDERAVFELELARAENSEHLRKYIGDSLLVNRQILPYQQSFEQFKSWCLATKTISEAEALEIFGNDPTKSFKLKKTNNEWTKEDFSKKVVSLKGEDTGKQNLNFFGMLHISIPAIRKDKKFALIQVDNIQEGGVLRVYKKTSNGWVFYKTINLYVT